MGPRAGVDHPPPPDHEAAADAAVGSLDAPQAVSDRDHQRSAQEQQSDRALPPPEPAGVHGESGGWADCLYISAQEALAGPVVRGGGTARGGVGLSRTQVILLPGRLISAQTGATAPSRPPEQNLRQSPPVPSSWVSLNS